LWFKFKSFSAAMLTAAKVSDIDLWEINEAFAAVSMAAEKDLNLNHNQVNIFEILTVKVFMTIMKMKKLLNLQ
jgi:hypothetical protein